jgi:hypothetical protein
MSDERFVLISEGRARRAEIERQKAGIVKGTASDFNQAVKEYMSIPLSGDKVDFTNALIQKFGGDFASEVVDQAKSLLSSDSSETGTPSAPSDSGTPSDSSDPGDLYGLGDLGDLYTPGDPGDPDAPAHHTKYL